MGIALYKADFLYPKHEPQPAPVPDDPDDEDTPPQSSLSSSPDSCGFFCPENYYDYSELA